MRGQVERQQAFLVNFNIEERIPQDHPLRRIKALVDAELQRLGPLFRQAYSSLGRPSIPPEQLLKALLLQALYSIRSERQLVDAINYNFLYRWFRDLQPDEPIWNATTFTKNRERFERHGLLQRFFDGVVAEGFCRDLMDGDHFTVDGTLIASWASMKSVRRIDSSDERVRDGSDDDDPGNPTVNWRGERRTNATHRSLTDPEARLARKGPGQAARLAHSGNIMMDDLHGLCVDIHFAEANGMAERDSAETMLDHVRRRHGVTPDSVGADKGYDSGRFLRQLEEERGITPYVPIRRGPIRGHGAEAEARRRARRRSRTAAYRLRQRARKRVEEIIGWIKTVGGLSRVRHVGRWKIQQVAYAAAAAYNLLRMAKLTAQAA